MIQIDFDYLFIVNHARLSLFINNLLKITCGHF